MKTVLFLILFLNAGIPNAFAGGSKEPRFLKPYIAIQSLLSRDSIENLPALSADLEATLQKDGQKKALPASKALLSSKSLADARAQFEKISTALLPWARKHPIAKIDLVYCPMKKAWWLQTSGDIRNPYYGAEMLECGVVEERRK